MSGAERVRAELEILGLDVSHHVVEFYAPMLLELGVVWSRDLLKQRSRSELLVAGVKVATQTPPIRSGRRVVFLTVDDGTGPVDATFFDDAQGPYAATVFGSWMLVVRGELRRTGPRGVSLRATGCWELTALYALWQRAGIDAVHDELRRSPRPEAYRPDAATASRPRPPERLQGVAVRRPEAGRRRPEGGPAQSLVSQPWESRVMTVGGCVLECGHVVQLGIEGARRVERRRSVLRTAVVWEALEQLLQAGPARPLRVVDLGGGTGGFAVRIGRLGHHVLVVDPSPDALASLERRAAEDGVTTVSGILGDADSLLDVVDPGTADLVLCHGLLEVVDDPSTALAAVGSGARHRRDALGRRRTACRWCPGAGAGRPSRRRASHPRRPRRPR